MTEKRTVYESTKALEDGTLLVKLRKEIVENGKVLWSEPHRTSIQPGEDVAKAMEGVTANLASGVMLKTGDVVAFPVADTSADRVKALAAVEHTPERVTKFKADKKEREDRERAIRTARAIN